MNRTLLLLVVAACGGGIMSADGGDDAMHDGGIVDSGFTRCSAPAGYKLCNGACGQTCPPDKDGNPGCASDEPGMPDPKDLGICTTTGDLGSGCERCPDSYVCVLSSEKWWRPNPSNAFALMGCGVRDWAIMYALNGRLDMARYADRSAYTDQPLPMPSSCPSVSGITLCGGACGGCTAGYVCVGRSPLHPYGLCVNEKSDLCDRNQQPNCMSVTADWRCLTFKVDTPSQPVADAHSICVDRSICDAAAVGYPGGAFCTGGK